MTRINDDRRIDGTSPQTFEPETEPFFPHKDTAKEPPRYETDAALLFAQNTNPKKSATDATSATTAPWPNDRVLYVGMNAADSGDGKGTPENDLEWNNLHFVTGGNCERIKTSSDVMTAEQAKAFVKTLGLDDERGKAVLDVLLKTPDAGRDEVAGIAKALARAYTSGTVPSRIILSGHYGDTITDGSGTGNALRTEDVRAIAKALPKGAAFVEDILVSGCYSGGKDQLEVWKTAFPNIRTAAGYGWQDSHGEGDKSPTGPNAVMHIQEWEKETRGRGTPAHMRSELGTVVGNLNISYWDGAYHPAISGQHDRSKP